MLNRLNNLATLLQDMGRYAEAEPLFREAIEIDKATIGEEHPDYAIRLNNLASLLRDMGKPEEASVPCLPRRLQDLPQGTWRRSSEHAKQVARKLRQTPPRTFPR